MVPPAKDYANGLQRAPCEVMSQQHGKLSRAGVYA
jgi:hypothetical protein